MQGPPQEPESTAEPENQAPTIDEAGENESSGFEDEKE